MADEEQVKRLLDGVEGWNKWRKENPSIEIDLTEANLWKAELGEADLREVNLDMANLRQARLIRADLRESFLIGADLRRAYLSGANLTGTDLTEATLARSILFGANLSESFIGKTDFTGINLSTIKGLDKVISLFRSDISTITLELSKGQIPEKFLRGCGMKDWEIEAVKLYKPGLLENEVDNICRRINKLRASQPLQLNDLFISYCHKDSGFVDVIEKHLDEKGIRFWRDIHNATAGRLEKVVDRAMRQNPTVLLVLSENSVQSDWVEHEARSARELEKELKRDVLCPVALDGAWKDCNWPARLREQIMEYNILDFSNWQDESEFTRKFAKLVEGLDLFYKE